MVEPDTVDYFPKVVVDEALELQAKHGIPARQLRKRRESERPLSYQFAIGFNELQVESGVVVGNPVADDIRHFSRTWIQARVLGDEPGCLQLIEIAGKMSVVLQLQFVGDFRGRLLAVAKRNQNPLLQNSSSIQ